MRRLMINIYVVTVCSILYVIASFAVSVHFKNIELFQASGAILTLAGVLLAARKIIRLGFKKFMQDEETIDGGHFPSTAEEEEQTKEFKMDMKAYKWSILLILIGTIIWAYGGVGLRLFSERVDNINNVAVETLAKSSTSWDGQTLPGYPKGKPEITILRIKIPSGAILPMHYHPVINAGVLLSGELTVVAKDKKTLHLKAGDSIVEVVNKAHYGKNEGSKTAEIIVFYAGIIGKPITVKYAH